MTNCMYGGGLQFVPIVNIIINKSLKIYNDQAYKILVDGIAYIVNINT